MAKRQEFSEAEAHVEPKPAKVKQCGCGQPAIYEAVYHGDHILFCERHLRMHEEVCCSPVRAQFIAPERRIIW